MAKTHKEKQMKAFGDLITSILVVLTDLFGKAPAPIPSAEESDNTAGKATGFDRHFAGGLILNYEARRDKDGHIEVYTPKGSQYEVAGITYVDHPEEARRLRRLLRAGEYSKAEDEARAYYIKYSDVAEDWFDIPSVEFFVRDCVVNRGPLGAAMIAQRALGVDVDGKWGPQSQRAAAKVSSGVNFIPKLRAAREWYELEKYGRREHVWDGLVNRWNTAAHDANAYFRSTPPRWRDKDTEAKFADIPAVHTNYTKWPRQDDALSYYGNPGQNQVMLRVPYPMYLSWDKGKKIERFSVNRRVHDSALWCLQEVARVYSPDEIEDLGLNLFGGCLNVRKMRGGQKMSMHSYGIAIDFDPARNQLRWGRDKARLAQPDAEKFWEIWESAGWRSLGRSHNYDWMHVQATA